jgi:ribosomal protein S18 acetylase RimI-like enzyme
VDILLPFINMMRTGYQDKSLVVQILCDAFDTNKSINYIVKQDGKRKARIKTLMEYSFDISQQFGEVFLSEDKKACALILYPEKKKATLGVILLDLKLAITSIGISRIGKVMEKERKTKANHPATPMLHLWFLGVAPSAQGKGAGKKLLGEIINKSTEINRPVYLETSMIENLDFYKKMKFEIYNEIDISYKIYLLRRNL